MSSGSQQDEFPCPTQQALLAGPLIRWNTTLRKPTFDCIDPADPARTVLHRRLGVRVPHQQPDTKDYVGNILQCSVDRLDDRMPVTNHSSTNDDQIAFDGHDRKRDRFKCTLACRIVAREKRLIGLLAAGKHRVVN